MGLQQAVEIEEVGVAVVGLGDQLVRFGFAFAARDRALLMGVGQHCRALAIGRSLNLLRPFEALRTYAGGSDAQHIAMTSAL